MLDIKRIRDDPRLIESKMRERSHPVDVDSLLEKDEERRALIKRKEELQRNLKETSRQIGAMKKEGKKTAALEKRMKGVSRKIGDMDKRVKEYDAELKEALLAIPNVQHSSVPVGESEEDNLEVRRWGKPPSFSFDPQNHLDVGEALGIVDLKRASKITGARFPFYIGLGARLERALINFMIELHVNEHGYREVLTPFMVNRESVTGTGQLPHFEDDLFHVEEDDFFLVPTAEVPVTNIHRDEILPAEALPVKYVAYTPCFRREAGSYGRDVRGLIRQHQFNKVELVKFVEPQQSYEELESLTRNAEEVLKRLDLHYRVVSLCTGDLGFASAKTYDIEVWLPGEQDYREISSCSNYEDYQARRMRIRYRPGPRKSPQYLHSLNGSGLAVGRTVVAILENYQQEDGSVTVPEALVPYMGGAEVITAERQ
jgi:seryl-tRNA synthetase